MPLTVTEQQSHLYKQLGAYAEFQGRVAELLDYYSKNRAAMAIVVVRIAAALTALETALAEIGKENNQ